MKLATSFLTIVFLTATFAAAQAAAASPDRSFVQAAQADELDQYALARLARFKATDSTTKSLARGIAANADKASIYIKAYARKNAVRLAGKPRLRADVQYADLQALSSTSFDRTFEQDVYIDSQLALSDFQDEAAHGKDPKLRAFAKRQVASLTEFGKTAKAAAGI